VLLSHAAEFRIDRRNLRLMLRLVRLNGVPLGLDHLDNALGPCKNTLPAFGV
jgi:hypothetical protein